jgi:hypothetical protein
MVLKTDEYGLKITHILNDLPLQKISKCEKPSVQIDV